VPKRRYGSARRPGKLVKSAARITAVLPTEELGVFSPYFDRESLLTEVEREVYYSQHGMTY
jgi:hypothetical protein